MERRVLIEHWQKVTQEDFNSFGIFPQESLDHVVGDLGVKTKAFTGFATTQSAAAEVTVGAGRLYINTGDGCEVFFNADAGGQAISMLGHLPVTAKRIVALTAYANEIDSETEPRTFLVDADTRATVARPVSTVRMRRAEISPVFGIEAPDPQPPAVAANVLPFAYVTLDTTGVASIAAIDDNRVTSIEALALSDRDMVLWRNTIGQVLDTLISDLAALASRIHNTATMDFAKRIAADLANTKRQMNLPEDYVSWSADYFLNTALSDTTHVDYLAKIEEGVRFPPAAEGTQQIMLLNPVDPAVTNQDSFVIPAYTEITRLSVKGGTFFEQSISQFPFQSTTMKQFRRVRRRYRYGEWYWLSVEAYMELLRVTSFDVGMNFLFTLGEVLEVAVDPTFKFGFVRVRYVWEDYYEVAYWERVIVTRTIAGSVLAESFLNAQDGWLTGVNLFFTRKGATGDVHVTICHTNQAGVPDMDKAVAYAAITPGQIKIGGLPTKVSFTPTFLSKGENGTRYAIVLHTAGNHFVALVEGNKFAQGTLFYSTDAGFYAGDLTKDLAFELLFARFASSRTEVQLQPLTLSGGIASIDVLAEAIVPAGSQLVYEIQIAGKWYSMSNPASPLPLNTLPPLLPWRAVLLGTTESMPGFGVSSNSRAYTSRPRSDFRHVSTVRTVPSTTSIDIDFRLDRWRGPPYHTFTPRLMTGAGYTTLTAPTLTQDSIAMDDPNAIIRSCHWTIAATTTFKIRMEGTTDNVLACYAVTRRTDVEG